MLIKKLPPTFRGNPFPESTIVTYDSPDSRWGEGKILKFELRGEEKGDRK